MSAQDTLKWATSGVLALSLLACGGGQAGSDGYAQGQDTLDTVVDQRSSGLMNLGGHLFSIPSPVQTAMLFRKLEIGYQKDLPLSPDQAGKLTGKVGRALALGMYGADLAYVTVHRDGSKAISTLGTIEMLSGQLDLSNAFDRVLLERFKKNVGSEDSLLVLTGSAFRAADEYLKENGRNDVSALVLAGGWIESLYLTVNATSSKGDAQLAQRIGEQKRTLDDLIKLLEEVDQDKVCGPLVVELKVLQTAYVGVTSTYVYEKPVTDAATKTTQINSTTSVTVPPDQIRAIGAQVLKLRSTILA
jgi:hypothetical protein